MTFEELCDHATLLAAHGDLHGAEPLLRRLTAHAPEHPRANRNLAHVLMAQGRYIEAAPFHRPRDALRAGARPKPTLPYPEWRGEPLAGKRLLIWPEQGLGDEIMFARFARWAHEQGAQVTLLCSPPLQRLFDVSLPAEVLATEGEVTFPDPDFWAMSADMLTEGGFTPATLPRAPYLFAPSQGRGVGIKTRGNPAHDNDARRSLPDDLAAELLSLPGAVDLDPSSTGATDFQETAKIVAGLDLVVSVDTSVAHLAGALGVPVWILLPHFNTDWRWMRGRDDSPWYPSARLFRQEVDEDWRPVIDRACAELKRSGNARTDCRAGRRLNSSSK